MAELGYVKALEALERDALRCRAYFIQTDKPMMQIELARRLQAAVVPDYADFNLARVHCTAQSGAGEIEAAGEELPIMAERRLVWVTDVNLLDDKQVGRLAAYLPQASPSTWFFICASRPRKAQDEAGGGGRGARLTPLVDAVRKHGLVVKDVLDENEQRAWVGREVERLGLSAEGSARELVVRRTNGDLAAMTTELEKLACFAGEQARVTAADVDLLVRDNSVGKSWDLTDAVNAGRAGAAVGILQRMLEVEMQHPLMVLGMLASQYRKLIALRYLQAARAPTSEMMKAVGAKTDGRVKGLLRTLAGYSPASLARAVEMLMAADEAMKTSIGSRHERFVLELLLVELCGLARSSQRD